MNSTTETVTAPQTAIKDSSQLVKKDIVAEHGMRVRLDKLTTVGRSGLTVYTRSLPNCTAASPTATPPRTSTCVWDYFDEYGYGGNSEFYAETETGLHEVQPDIHQWLSGEQDLPGPISTWVCAPVTEPAEFAGGDDFHNYARQQRD